MPRYKITATLLEGDKRYEGKEKTALKYQNNAIRERGHEINENDIQEIGKKCRNRITGKK